MDSRFCLWHWIKNHDYEHWIKDHASKIAEIININLYKWWTVRVAILTTRNLHTQIPWLALDHQAFDIVLICTLLQKGKQCRFIVWRTSSLNSRASQMYSVSPLLLLSLSKKRECVCVMPIWGNRIENNRSCFFWIQHFYSATSKLVLRGGGEPKKWLLLTRVVSTEGLVPKEYGVGEVW